MFASQTSSSSSSSLQSLNFEESNQQSAIPEKFNQIAVLRRAVYFDDFSFVDIVITSEFEIIECSDGEVVNYLNLKAHLTNNVTSVCKESVDFCSILDENSVTYAVKIGLTVFGIERKSSQMKVLKVLENVNSIQKIVEDSGEVLFLVTFCDNKQKQTKFLDEDLENFLNNKSSERFAGIFEAVNEKVTEVKNVLSKLTEQVEEMSLKLMGEAPAALRMLDPDLKAPLVRYGSIWTRVLNDHLVIGIPIFCVSQTRLLLENLKLHLLIEDAKELDFHYETNLFKMQSDQLSFERFEELFETEEGDPPNQPEFENEWRQSEGFFLHANQSGVLVSSINVIQFIDSWIKTIKFFVTYDINHDGKEVTLTLDAGELSINAKTIFGSESEIGAERIEIYKDLLAITVVSTMIEMTVKFEKPPRKNFQEFLKESLKFSQLNGGSGEEQEATNVTDRCKLDNTEKMDIDDDEPKLPCESFFFYCDDKYFKGMLVRMKVISDLEIALKIYIRSPHQIVVFSKAIYEKYSERCSVTVQKGDKR